MTTRRLHRPGVTLTEVLVAIFVMAIGLLALLTLFPLGAIQMAQAIKDDRTAGEAAHADALIRSHWRHVYLPPATPPGTISSSIYGADPFFDPQAGMPTPTHSQRIYTTAGFYPTTSDVTPPGQPRPFPEGSPSYPVMLDGLGYFARPITTNHERCWVGRNSTLPAAPATPTLRLMPRRSSLGFVNQPSPVAPLIEAFSLTDDLTFERNGAAKSGPVERQGRYNWSAIVQLPRHDTRGVAKLTIMVYDGRPPLLATDGDETIATVPSPVTIGDRSITITVPARGDGAAPLVRKGGWILDSTTSLINISQTVNNPAIDQMWVRNANFYRIAGVTDLGPVAGGNQFTLDLETPIKPLWDGRATFRDTGAPLTYTPTICLFAGLSEVFERSDLRPETPIN